MDVQRAWVATRKGLFELRRTAEAWRIERISFLGEPVSMVLPPQEGGRMLAALNLGHFGVKVHASEDAGFSWHEVATPGYPAQPEGAPGPAWKLLQLWSLEAAHDVVWAGTLPGGLFRSPDFGQSWQLVDALWNRPERAEWFGGGYDVPGIHSICPHPQRPGELLVGISCGGVWLSRDGGADWRLQAERHARRLPAAGAGGQPEHAGPASDCALQQGARRAVVPASQRHLAVHRQRPQLAGGAGAPLSSFGFALGRASAGARHGLVRAGQGRRMPRADGGGAVVNRTRDGGRSFDTLRRGLPQEHCYDLVYRHGLALGADGRTLLMGSTTGNLWGSSDGGDSWQAVSQHLPPIYALRIG